MTHKITLIVPFKLVDDNNHGVEKLYACHGCKWELYDMQSIFWGGLKMKFYNVT